MELEDRIEALLQVLRADSPRGAKARRRVIVTAAMGTAFAVLLALIGFLDIVLIVGAVAATLAASLAAVLLVRRFGSQFAANLRLLVARAVAGFRFMAAAARPAVTRLIQAGSRGGASARGKVEARIPQVRDRYSRARAAAIRSAATATTHAQRHARSAATSVATSASKAWPTRTPIVRQREAIRANAAGVQLRRDGAYLEAAEHHRLALVLFRELGDRRSEALTLNNLALALDRTDDGEALDLFEQAATILGQLGDEEHEGRVIANLGLAFRRRGREEQSDEVLETALEKLDPESQAYRTIERLRRAS